MLKVIFIIGPPGSGKGTQAEMLAEKLNLFHIETSKILEEKFALADKDDERIKTEFENWKNGKLVSPELTVDWVVEQMKKIHSSGRGFVTSGSPRTVEEIKVELPLLENLYGQENIKIIHIKLSKEESIKRNSKRRVCAKNRHPIPDFPEYKNIETCPFCGEPITTRLLDKPETIAIRYQVYLDQTEPIFSYLKNKGNGHIDINGEQSIEKVFEEVIAKIND